MTPTQPPAPTGATARELPESVYADMHDALSRYQIDFDDWSAEDFDDCVIDVIERHHAALADAGLCIVDTQRAFDMAVALADAHIDGNLEPCTCPDCLFALEFMVDVHAHDAARQPEGVRE